MKLLNAKEEKEKEYTYVYDQFEDKILKYDKKFDKEISEVKRLIHKIEMDFPDYDDYTTQNAFDALDSIKSRCRDVMYRHKNQDNVNLHLEDSLVDDIKYYMKEKSDETIQERYKDAQVVHAEIKKSRKETSNIITKLLQTKSSQKTKLIEKLIENSKIWKHNREELLHIESIIARQVSYLKIDPKDRPGYVVEPK
ncbi:MAG TPA: hypothetical protein VND01_00355 [Candidatus Acidoferrales bacterium]|nr:hypothetical protein [Candidatus Acidoferrales bacterium]